MLEVFLPTLNFRQHCDLPKSEKQGYGLLSVGKGSASTEIIPTEAKIVFKMSGISALPH